jgi:hypothetical protein
MVVFCCLLLACSCFHVYSSLHTVVSGWKASYDGQVHNKGRAMDIEEFEKQVEPRAKRSRLEPFQAQIFELKAKGYANWQVSEWLAANGLKVSQEGVRKFIKSREGKAERVHAPVSGGQATQGQRVHVSTLNGQQAEKPAAAPQGSTLDERQSPAGPLSTGGKLRSQQVLDAPNKSFSFKQLQQDAKDKK